MKRSERATVFAGASLLVFASLAGCARDGTGERAGVERLARPMMGTFVEVLWQTEGRQHDMPVVRSTLDRMEDLASRMNLRNPDSEVSRIVASAGKEPVRVSAEVLEVIEKALEVSRVTGGAFDITVGALESAWGDIQWEGGGRLPAEEEIQDALPRVGYRFVRTDREEKTVYLEKQGARLDLGGIAKGYVVDQGIRRLREAGIGRVLINAGGDMRSMGGSAGSPWRIGLQDPKDRGRLLGVFRMKDAAVATSGSYERYFECREGRFGHVLDPRTGRPAGGLLSVTVMAEEAALADALATAFMVEGKKGAIDLALGMASVQAVIIEDSGAIWISWGLEGLLEMGPLSGGYKARLFPGPSGPS